MDHPTRTVLLPELWILRIIVTFRLLLGIQVIQVAKELIEAMVGREMLVAITEMVLAELARRVAERLQQFGNGRLVLGDALRRTRHADGQ